MRHYIDRCCFFGSRRAYEFQICKNLKTKKRMIIHWRSGVDVYSMVAIQQNRDVAADGHSGVRRV